MVPTAHPELFSTLNETDHHNLYVTKVQILSLIKVYEDNIGSCVQTCEAAYCAIRLLDRMYWRVTGNGTRSVQPKDLLILGMCCFDLCFKYSDEDLNVVFPSNKTYYDMYLSFFPVGSEEYMREDDFCEKFVDIEIRAMNQCNGPIVPVTPMQYMQNLFPDQCLQNSSRVRGKTDIYNFCYFLLCCYCTTEKSQTYTTMELTESIGWGLRTIFEMQNAPSTSLDILNTLVVDIKDTVADFVKRNEVDDGFFRYFETEIDGLFRSL